MKKVVKKIVALAITAAMIPINGIMPTSAKAANTGMIVRLDPSNASPFNDGEFQGWGTSLCWWANRVGYSDALTQQAAKAFFSDEGLSLDIARYNLGGGDDPTHNHITRSDSKIPGYATGYDEEGNIVYDWTVDENQRNVMKAAMEANPDIYIEGFSNSPPYFMTNSGCSAGAVDANTNNLKETEVENFAKFIAQTTKHFKEEFGITFESYSPMNEPDTNYWGANSNKQEGCHYDPGTMQSNMIIATRNALDAEGLNDVLVAGMDETSIDKSVTNFGLLTDEAKAALGRLDTHTYSGSKRAQLKQTAIDGGKNLWMSEVDGNWDAMGIADRILTDMNGMQPSAWVIWDIIDSHKDANFTAPDGSTPEAGKTLDRNGKMWGVGMADHDTENLELSQKYYGWGQFTRYIKPGMTIIASASNTLAAYDKKTGEIAIVAVNSSGNDVTTTFDMGDFTKVGTVAQPIRTSGTYESGEQWAELDTIEVSADKKFTTDLKANSITTFVIEGDGNPVDYMTMSGSGTIVEGIEYSYTVVDSLGNAADVVWSVSDETIATVTSDGKVTATQGGSFTLKATRADGTFTAMDVNVIAADGVITITNKNSGLGLETRAKSIASGTQLVQWAYRGLDTSAWQLAATDDGHFNIKNKNADMLLAANADGKPVISSEITDDNAKWDLINHGGYYEVKNVALQKSLNVSGQSVSNGGSVILYAFGGGDNELWSLGEITGELEHVVPVVIDYSEKYKGTDYTYVSNIDALTNDFADDLKGFVTSGFAGLGADASGELVLMPQNSLANSSNKQRAGSATLTLETPAVCEVEETINLAFDMYTANSAGDSDFVLSSSNGTELVSIKVSNYGNDYVIKIGGTEVKTASDGHTYFMNNQTGNSNSITSGGHVEIYYTPSSGAIMLALKNVTNTAAMQTMTGSVEAGLDIGKVYFAGTYTAWNKQMLVDNFVTNIIKMPEIDIEPTPMPEPTAEPTPEPTLHPLEQAAKDMAPPKIVTENIDMVSSEIVVSKFDANSESISYHYTIASSYANYDKYFAIYDQNGALKAVTINEPSKTISGDFTNSKFKLMIWDEMSPVIEAETAYSNQVFVEWNSSDTSVITNDGIVTRGDTDKRVILTAVFTSGEETLTKEYNVTVKANGAILESDMEAYLFVHFVGTESNAESEQIYFSLSKDGTNWQTLNSNKPILTSNVGEQGVRDPHIIRSPEGDKFFLIATDLSIYNRRDDSNRWGTCQKEGSQSIVIWESEDLVNWSDARLVKVAPDNAGCTWAPESIYDEEKEQYMVFWASKVDTDDYTTQRIYRSYTSDFVTFTEPEIYMDGGNVSNIDTTFVVDGYDYYRFTKNESKSSIIMQKSQSLNGEFEDIATYKINGVEGNAITGYEGPTAYKINGEDKWCLLLDYYSKSEGYKPFVTEDISKGEFVSAPNFNFDTKYRHGTVMPITKAEYDALLKQYTVYEEGGEGEVIFALDFDNENAEASIGTTLVNGELSYTDGYNGGKAAVLDGTDYIEIKGAEDVNLLAGLETFTVSFASKTNAQSWWFYVAPNETAQTYLSEKYVGVLDSSSKITCERYNSNNSARPTAATAGYTSGEWKHITLVHHKNSFVLYVNGERVSTIETDVALNEMLGENPIAYIGKANWGTGEYSSGVIDAFKVYNYAMNDDSVKSEYDALNIK